MAVLIEALNLIIKDDIFNENPAKRELFLNSIPSKAFCSDGVIFRIGFMDSKYVTTYIDFLEKEIGLRYLNTHNKAQDMVVIDMLEGPTSKCDWIDFKREKLFSHRKEFQKSQEDFSIAWRIDKYEGIPESYLFLNPNETEVTDQFSEKGISFPYDWTPDNAIYTSDFTSNPQEDLEEISRDDKVITYKKKSTGEILYVGIPDVEIDDSRIKPTDEDSSYDENNSDHKIKISSWDKLKKLFK